MDGVLWFLVTVLGPLVLGLVIGKAPSRLVKRAHEIVADELAAKPELATLAATLLGMRASVVERIEALDRRLRARARTTPVCRRLVTVPGVGRSPRSPFGRASTTRHASPGRAMSAPISV